MLMVLARIGWTPHTATHFTTHTGLEFDLNKIAPAAVARYAANATQHWSDRKATEGKNGEPGIIIFWDAIQGLLKGPRSKHGAGTTPWNQTHRNALVFLLAGSEWPQHRQYTHGKADTADCKLCGLPQCTIWHRRYECDAWHQDRQTRPPSFLLEAASRIRSSTLRERFAKGLLPAPAAIIPRPLITEEVTTQWVNKPGSGRLTGSLFLDGSGTGGSIPFLRRAGWAIVQVDPDGNLVAAAYGAVPWDAAPAQVARDAEDYAVFMLSKVAALPFTLYIDCAGTMGAARNPQVGTKPRHLRSHLWDDVWKHFKELQVHKTKAHATEADIVHGATTRWQMDGNTLADQYAKLGVEAHGITAQQCLEIRALTKIAYHAAKWAASQYVIMSKEERKDSDMLQPKQKLPQAKSKAQPRPPRSGSTPACSNTQQATGKHSIRACTVSDNATLLFCGTCGAFKWKRTSKLGAPCPLHIAGPGARQRLNMIKRGRFPNSSLHMSIGPHTAPTAEELSTIRVTQRALDSAIHSSWSEKWNRLAQPSGATLTRADILEAYGQNEESIKAHTAVLAANDARRNPPPAPA